MTGTGRDGVTTTSRSGHGPVVTGSRPSGERGANWVLQDRAVSTDQPVRSPERTLPIATHRRRGCVVLTPTGVVDSSTVWVFRRAVSEVTAGLPVVVDLEGVTFMDSAGLGALIGATRRVRERGGDLAVAGPRRPVRRLLQTTGIDRIVYVAASAEEATGTLAGWHPTSTPC